MSNSTTDGNDTQARSKEERRRKSKKAKAGADVIHVAFGPGGGRIPPAALGNGAKDASPANVDPSASTKAPSIPPPPTPGEPVTDVFSARDVAKLLGLTLARLRTLDRSGIVSPTGERGGKRVYTFHDLIALRATHGLLAHKVKPSEVAKAIDALRRTLPRVTRPL